MSAVLVDANVLLDLLTEDAQWFDWSAQALARGADSRRLVINPIVYAEVSVRFTRIEELEAALPFNLVDREPIPYFFIGAHAAVAGYDVLTRDPTRYRTYFPKLTLIAPDR